MAVTEQTPRNVSTATAGATVFPYSFKIVSKGDIRVEVDGVAKTVDVDFTVSGVGSDAGGNVTFITPLVGGETVARVRSMKYARPTDYQNLGDLRSATLNNDQDASVLMVQQLAESVERSLRVPVAYGDSVNAELPAPAALKPLVWNAAGTALENGDTTLTGDMLLRGELASTDAAKGTNLVTFKRSAVAQALPVALEMLLRETWHLIECIPDNERAAILNYTSTYDASGVINDFLAAANAQGVSVVTGPGLFCHASPIQFGNPPASNPSVINGIRFIGAGVGRNADTMNANDAPTIFRYIGAAGGTCMKIAGPISGVHLEGFLIDGNGLAATILDSQRSFHQTVRQVTGVNWTNGFGLQINADSPLGPTYGGAAPIDHLYEQFNLKDPGAGAHSLDIANGNGNVNQVRFVSCYLDRGPGTSTIGLRAGYCDHISFYGGHLAQTGASGGDGIAVQVRSQPGFASFPWNITFTSNSQAGGISYDNSLETWSNPNYPALIYQPYFTADGAPVPPKEANGGVELPQGMVRGWTDNGISIGWDPERQEEVVSAATIAPRTGTIILSGSATVTTITPPRSVWSVPVGGFRLRIIASGAGLKLATGGNIAEAVDLSNQRAIDLVYSEGTGFWHVVSGSNLLEPHTWTPTLTGITNHSASTARECMFMRKGNVVHFSGRIEVTPTAAGDAVTVVELTLPITPAAFGNSWEAAGTATAAFTPYRPGLIIAQGTSMRIQFHSAGTTSVGVIFSGSYQLA